MRHLFYIGIAAGTIVVGVGAYMWRKLHSKCPTKAEMADILLAIDSGRTGRNEADMMAARFDAQGCADAARAVRSFIAKKYPSASSTAMPSGSGAAVMWPDTDPVCRSAIDQLPTTPRLGLGGLKLSSYRTTTRDAITDALKSGDPKGLYHVADLLDSAEKDAPAGLGPVFARAATCLRDKADELAKMKPAKAKLGTSPGFATGGSKSLPPRFAERLRKTKQPVRGT